MNHVRIAIAVSFLALSACTQMQDTGQRMGADAVDSAQDLSDKLKAIFAYEPREKGEKPVSERYCYRVMQDIMCYADAIPGAEARLVGYQGNVEVRTPRVKPRPALPPVDVPNNPAGPTGADQAAMPGDAVVINEPSTMAAEVEKVDVVETTPVTPMRMPVKLPSGQANATQDGLKPLKTVTVGALPPVRGTP